MDVQGSGYIDFGDGSPLNFFSYCREKRLAVLQHR
ncbi:membrane-bound lytic murein transglycosylase A [Klebsiella michiganensis]|nr:membrane-bound lytic murein transglycosylase A [Klebsiella michiganensis]